MKNFLHAVFVFCLLAVCSHTIAGTLTDSPEFKAFNWHNSEPVKFDIVINQPSDNSGHANTKEIKRRLMLQGLHDMSVNIMLDAAFEEFYECPYLEYGQELSDIFPREVKIKLLRTFARTQYGNSERVVFTLRKSGLKDYEAQSLYYNGLDEYLACVLED